MPRGAHDEGARRKALRKGRESGCSIYIPGELLERIGFADSPRDRPIYYRTWAGRKGTVLVQLYTEP